MLKCSENGKNLIKEFEGLRLNAYRCSSGVWTIGYGHTGGGKVKSGDFISKKVADELFDKDIEKFEYAVNKLVTVPLSQNQFDALVSFCFNNGYGDKGFGGSTMRFLLNQSKYEQAAKEFPKWVYSVGKVSEGLRRRRLREMDLFLKPD